VSRGFGCVQRFVLAALAECKPRWVDGWQGRYWHPAYRSVVELAYAWVHSRQCDDDGGHYGCTWRSELTRADIESVRRAVKALERAGRVEIRRHQVETRVSNSTLGGQGWRWQMQARTRLSVEQSAEEQSAQHLERRERDRALADITARIR
jgi:hypothetical protein